MPPTASSAGVDALPHAWQVDFDGHSVNAIFEAASGGSRTTYVLAHGAGGHMADRSVLAAAAALRACSLNIVRFNYPYTERKSHRPDPMPLLQRCIAAVATDAAHRYAADRWILGGRSMGGRAASMLVADGHACDGLLLLAYPLHAAGKPDKLRDAHLPRIEAPVLCFNGTRDPLCDKALMDAVVTRLASNWAMHWLDGADHSFHVLRSSGRDDAGVMAEVAGSTARWLSATEHRRTSADAAPPR